uniref:Anthranilate synthase n=1 Tax=Strobilanthes cusia TaxID=222567 RepID=A0A4D6RNU1_9LAMI|nr:anthranilate synthase [Strobilanthes cusia]
MSRSPKYEIPPKPPLYGPLLVFSSLSINSIAFTFGAPLTVPTGSAARSASHPVILSSNSPVTVELMCITWEYLSTFMSLCTLTEPYFETLPTSFLPRSTSIICSARCFSSFRRFLSRFSSSIKVFPLLVVPAKGRLVIMFFFERVRISGLEATRMQPLACM